jgi:3-hydroxyacyl-[acyl-carrier-protein] dehydratase
MRFILIDDILELVPGRTIRAVKTMSSSEELFRDHFPGFPVVPGVILTEMMAQAAGKCLIAEDQDRGFPMLARIISANFRSWAKPGQPLIISSSIRVNRPQHATADGRVEVNDQLIADAQLFFTFVPRDKFAAELKDEVLERWQTACSHRGNAVANEHAEGVQQLNR